MLGWSLLAWELVSLVHGGVTGNGAACEGDGGLGNGDRVQHDVASLCVVVHEPLCKVVSIGEGASVDKHAGGSQGVRGAGCKGVQQELGQGARVGNGTKLGRMEKNNKDTIARSTKQPRWMQQNHNNNNSQVWQLYPPIQQLYYCCYLHVVGNVLLCAKHQQAAASVTHVAIVSDSSTVRSRGDESLSDVLVDAQAAWSDGAVRSVSVKGCDALCVGEGQEDKTIGT